MVKKEIVRLHNVSCTWGRGHSLSSYNLTIFSGEILCVVGVSGCGKTAIEKILLGEATLKSGTLCLNGTLTESHDPANAFAQGIYTVGTMKPMVANFTIAENLEAMRNVRNPFKVYCEAQATAAATEILRELQLEYPPDKLVGELSFLEEQLLSIAKIIQCGAKLVIINCVHNSYSAWEAQILAGYMQRWKERGISFLIICERLNPFFDVADSVHVISRGTDLYQWQRDTFPVELFYRQWERAANFQEYAHGENSIKAVCLMDNTWDSKNSFYMYLQTLKQTNPEIWEQYIAAQLPDEGQTQNGRTVIIPSDSAAALAENLSIADNLSLCIPHRVGIGKLRVIHRGMQQVLLQNFRDLIHLTDDVEDMEQLTEVQKKILSIHRWELSSPDCIILEDPFWGMDMNEMLQLHDYLLKLSSGDIRVVAFIRDTAELKHFGGALIVSDRGRNAQAILPKN